MSKHSKRTAPVRHLFIDTHQLTPAQRERLAKRLGRLLGLQYRTESEYPGDGTATVLVHWELESIERLEARVWRLIQRVYKPRLLLDGEITRLRSLHDALPAPDVSREVARREERHGRTGFRSASLLPTDAVGVYPLGPDRVDGGFDPDTGEPPVMESDDLNRQVEEHYPDHQSQAKEFIRALDGFLRHYVRLFMAETGPRWRARSCSGDAACAAFGYFRGIVADAVCHTTRAG